MSIESEVQENTRTMKEMLAQMRGGTNYNPQSSYNKTDSSIDTSGIKNAFFGAVGSVETFVGKLVRQTAGIPDVGDVVIKTISPLFGKLSETLGSAFGGVIRYMDDSVKNWQDFSKLGPTMYGNTMNVNVALGKMRLQYDDFSDVIKSMGTGGLAFGKSMSESTILFSESVDFFAKSDYQKNFQMLGIKEKERAEIMATVIRNFTGLNLSSAEGMEKAASATDKLAKSMTLTAEITGVTREKQMDAIKEFKDDLRTYSAKEEHILNGDYIYAELSNAVADSMKGAPAMLRDAAVQAAGNNGQVYGKAQETLNLLAPNTLALIQSNSRIMQDVTKSDEERKKAAKGLETAQFKFTSEVMSNATRMYSKYDQLTAEQKQTLKEIQPLREAVSNVIAKSKGTKTTDEALTELVKTGEATLAGIKTLPEGSGQPGKPGEYDAGRESTMAYLNVQNRIKDLGNDTIQTVSIFNTGLGKAGSALEKFNLNPFWNSGKGYDRGMSQAKDALGLSGGSKPEDMITDKLKAFKSVIKGSIPMNVEDISPQDRHFDGGSTSPGRPSMFGEDGFEYKTDEAASRVYNNGQTKTLIASMTDGMRMFPILSSQLQRVAPEVAQTISSAVASVTSSTNSSSGQNPMLDELKKLNTNTLAVASLNKAMVDGINNTVRAIKSSDSVYG